MIINPAFYCNTKSKVFSTDLSFFFFTLCLALFFCISLFAGCGYHMLGNGCYSTNPVGAPYLINVNPILNRTAQPGLALMVTEGIIKELANWPYIRLAGHKEAEYYLCGEVTSFDSQIPYSYDNKNNAVEYKVSFSLNLSLARKEGDNPLSPFIDTNKGSGSFKGTVNTIHDLKDEEIYPVSQLGLAASRRCQWEALERMLNRMIKKGMDQLLGIQRCN